MFTILVYWKTKIPPQAGKFWQFSVENKKLGFVILKKKKPYFAELIFEGANQNLRDTNIWGRKTIKIVVFPDPFIWRVPGFWWTHTESRSIPSHWVRVVHTRHFWNDISDKFWKPSILSNKKTAECKWILLPLSSYFLSKTSNRFLYNPLSCLKKNRDLKSESVNKN